MRVDRFTLAKAFNVHPGSVAVWLREGLSVALVERLARRVDRRSSTARSRSRG